MEHDIYSYSLCIALPLMLFFGFSFLFQRVPDKAIFGNYLRSRRIMGAAILLLAANYAVHFFVGVRYINQQSAILLNLSTYFLTYWLFASSLATLLNRFYITQRRQRLYFSLWIVYSLLSAILLFLVPEGKFQLAGIVVLAVWLMAHGLYLSWKLIKAYRRAVKIFDDSSSDDIGAYIHWMSVLTFWAIIFGVGCALLTFLPDNYVWLWILSSVPFYIYIYICYQNYLLFYEQVEHTMEEEVTSDEETGTTTKNQEEKDLPTSISEIIAEKLGKWVEAESYIQPGVNIQDLSKALLTNRTYLSQYINTTYKKTFRSWITDLRLEYAKRRMIPEPEKTIADIAEGAGFQSMSHFMKTFKESEGCPPMKWRKAQTFTVF